MKKKTLYILMGCIVALSVVLFAAINFLNWQNKIEKVASIPNQDSPPVFNHLINGDFSTPLDKPMDVAKIGEFIYVTDTNNKQVQVFDISGTSFFRFGKEGEDDGDFRFPYGITGDKENNVYVADLYTGKISIFNSKGKFIKYFKEQAKNKFIEAPAGLRIINNKLYVTDIKKSSLYVFSLDGKKEMEITQGQSPEDKLAAPNAVALDNDGNIFISDSGNQRVLEFDKQGKYLATINGSENGKGQSTFVNPRGIAVDSRGILYVVNNLASNIAGFNKSGKKIFEFGSMGDEKDQFYLPNGLNIDDNGTIYITDTVNQRVAVYY